MLYKCDNRKFLTIQNYQNEDMQTLPAHICI